MQPCAPSQYHAEFRIDVSDIPDWTQIEVFNRAQSLLTLLPTGNPPSELLVELTLTGGVHTLSALVTHKDGTTMSTTDIVAFTVVPEPGGQVLCLALVGSLLVRSRHSGSAQRGNSAR